MNLNDLMKKLQPELTKFEITTDTFVFIHRPTQRDIEKCKDVNSTIIHCVKDENGDPVFSDKDEDGRINVGQIDFVIANKIYTAVLNLLSNDKVEEIEKK